MASSLGIHLSICMVRCLTHCSLAMIMVIVITFVTMTMLVGRIMMMSETKMEVRS